MSDRFQNTREVNGGLAEMLRGGVIMDVGCLDHLGVAHARHPAVTADVGGNAFQRHHRYRPGVLGDLRLLPEAQVLEAIEVDYIDESEVLTPADEANHIDKWSHSCAAPPTSARRFAGSARARR